MQIDVFTLFPDWFGWFEGQRHVANARAAGHELRYASYRDHSELSGRQVDDTPFGGGAGMVLRVDVVDAALQGFYGRDSLDVRRERRVVALTASGRVLDDALVDELAREPALTLLSGRYEGFDERVVENLATDAISIGRYVLSGESWRRWCSWTRSCASSPARSDTRSRRSRRASARRSRGRPSIRTTRGRPNTGAGRSPRCC